MISQLSIVNAVQEYTNSQVQKQKSQYERNVEETLRNLSADGFDAIVS